MKDVKPFLNHIVDECAFIEGAIKDKTFEDFMRDEILKRREHYEDMYERTDWNKPYLFDKSGLTFRQCGFQVSKGW